MVRTNKYQTKINVFYNLIMFVINAVIGIFLPPFIVKSLGMSIYSLIPLSMSITSFMLIVTIAINGALSRFLSLDFEINSHEVNKTFSTSFYMLIIIFLILSPFVIFFILYPNSFLNIEIKYISDARLLFCTTILAFIFNTFSSLYNSITYVKNRIDLRNISLIINRLGIILVIGFLFLLGYINVQAYGISVLIATIGSLVYSIFTTKKIFPELSIKYSYFDKQKFGKIYKLGFWLIINQVGVLLFLQTDIILVNKTLGAEMSGVYGTLLQWSFLIRSVIGIIAGVLGPLTLNLFANGKTSELIVLTKFSTKIIGLFSTIITVVLMYFSSDILYVWLGQNYIQYKWLLVIVLFHLGFNLGYSSIINLNIAYDKAKIPGIVTLVTGSLNILLGYYLLKYTDLGLIGIAISGAISLTIKNLIFTPIYTSKILGINLFIFFKPIIPSLIITFLGVCLTYFVPSDIFNVQSIFELLFLNFCFFILIGSLIYITCLNSIEKTKILSFIKSKSVKNG